MKTHTGTITTIENKPYGYRLQIGKIWFTYKGKVRGLMVGDKLEVEYDESDKYKTITSLLQGREQKKGDPPQKGSLAPYDKDSRIIKAVALKAAVEVAAAFIGSTREQGRNVSTQGIIQMARDFEPYLKGGD